MTIRTFSRTLHVAVLSFALAIPAFTVATTAASAQSININQFLGGFGRCGRACSNDSTFFDDTSDNW